MKTILTTTYAVNPFKGSEDAMGWNYVYQIARFNKVIAITRENNRPHIEAYMAAHPDPIYANIEYRYYDLPKSLRWWKRGTWGAMLYFQLWQRGVIRFIKREKLAFDITHHLNFHNDWTPSFLWKLGKPFVWGPIGHHPITPEAFRASAPLKDRSKELLTGIIKRYFWNWSPNLEQTKNNADFIWCMNKSVPTVLNLTDNTYRISPSVATQDHGWLLRQKGTTFRVLSAGRLVHMKGFDLTIRSFADFVRQNPQLDATLTIVGDGPEKQRLQQLITTLGVSNKVEMLAWVPRPGLMELMKQSSVFLFPSHEGAGMVVPEALSFGLPVITLDNCGPGEFISPEYGVVVKANSYAQAVAGLSNGLSSVSSDKQHYQKMRQAARDAFTNSFSWDRRGVTLQSIYAKL